VYKLLQDFLFVVVTAIISSVYHSYEFCTHSLSYYGIFVKTVLMKLHYKTTLGLKQMFQKILIIIEHGSQLLSQGCSHFFSMWATLGYTVTCCMQLTSQEPPHYGLWVNLFLFTTCMY